MNKFWSEVTTSLFIFVHIFSPVTCWRSDFEDFHRRIQRSGGKLDLNIAPTGVPRARTGKHTLERFNLEITCTAEYRLEWISNFNDTNIDLNSPSKREEYTLEGRAYRSGMIFVALISLSYDNGLADELTLICRSISNHSDNALVTLKPNISSGRVHMDFQRSELSKQEQFDNPNPTNDFCPVLFYVISTPEGYSVEYLARSSGSDGLTIGSVEFRNCSTAAHCANSYRIVKVGPSCVTIRRDSSHDALDSGSLIKPENYRPGLFICKNPWHRKGESPGVPVVVGAAEYFFTGNVQQPNSKDTPILHVSLAEVSMLDFIRLEVTSNYVGAFYTVEILTIRCSIPWLGFSHNPRLIAKLNGSKLHKWKDFNEVIDVTGGEGWLKTVELDLRRLKPGTLEIRCTGAVWNTTELVNRTVRSKLRNVVPPHFEETDKNVTWVEGDINRALHCDVSGGDPVPVVTWQYSESTPATHVGDELKFFQVVKAWADGNDSFISCTATNTFGDSAVKTFKVHVNARTDQADGEPKTSTSTIAVTAVIALICVAVLVLVLAFSYFRCSTVVSILTDEEVKEFLEGRLSTGCSLKTGNGHTTNSEYQEFDSGSQLSIEHLPYNSDLEVPREKLFVDFRNELGSGQYGVVFKGTIDREIDAEDETSEKVDVAVKTVRPHVPIEYFKALLSELKILAYIGRHENVANLIGASTSNIKNRELYVAVELCAGSLLEFLRDNAQAFKSFVDTTHGMLSAETCFNEYANQEAMTANRPLSTFDLIRFASEIASGMEFLSRKRVVHADLATRNVLLSFTLHAKICDFGLARQLVDYTYIKSSKCCLPWKWMAIESLTKMEFTVMSDVWSFGVTCWEIFSLGSVPYPCMTWSWDFVDQLAEGRRLSRPKYGSQLIYNVMVECWQERKEARPTFAELKRFFEAQTKAGVELANHNNHEDGVATLQD